MAQKSSTEGSHSLSLCFLTYLPVLSPHSDWKCLKFPFPATSCKGSHFPKRQSGRPLVSEGSDQPSIVSPRDLPPTDPDLCCFETGALPQWRAGEIPENPREVLPFTNPTAWQPLSGFQSLIHAHSCCCSFIITPESDWEVHHSPAISGCPFLGMPPSGEEGEPVLTQLSLCWKRTGNPGLCKSC